MKQVKVFTYADSHRLEKNLNKWLEDAYYNNGAIENILYQTVKEKSLTVYSAMIVYETV